MHCYEASVLVPMRFPIRFPAHSKTMFFLVKDMKSKRKPWDFFRNILSSLEPVQHPDSLYRAHWKTWIFGWFFPIGLTCNFEKRWFGFLRPTFSLANFNICLLAPQENAFLWSQFVLGWVQRNSNFGSSDCRDSNYYSMPPPFNDFPYLVCSARLHIFRSLYIFFHSLLQVL